MFNKIYSELFYIREKVKDKFQNLTDDEKKIYGTTYKCASLFVFILMIIGISSNLFFATDSGNPFIGVFNDVYKAFIGVSTTLAVFLVAVNLITIMTSKNQRKTEQAVTWIKAIAVAWLFLMLTSVFIVIIKSAVGDVNKKGSNSQYSPIFEYGN